MDRTTAKTPHIAGVKKKAHNLKKYRNAKDPVEDEPSAKVQLNETTSDAKSDASTSAKPKLAKSFAGMKTPEKMIPFINASFTEVKAKVTGKLAPKFNEMKGKWMPKAKTAIETLSQKGNEWMVRYPKLAERVTTAKDGLQSGFTVLKDKVNERFHK